MKRTAKNAVKRLIAGAFTAGQRLGVDILPRHFYSEIPDIRRLRRTENWRRPYPMTGVAGADPDGQLAAVTAIVGDDLRRRLARGDVHAAACARNGEAGYGPIEADFLFAFVAARRPGHIVQIGCGVSTAVCLMAAGEVGYRPTVTCIEPHPNAFLTAAARDGEIELVPKRVEELDHAFLADLGAGDLFFVDSSHTLGPAGEVTRIILEMLPRLPAGAVAHFHDIWFPYDYSPHVLAGDLFFWHETALLLAYLAFNSRTRVLASLSMLHHARRAELAAVLPNYRPREDRDGVALTAGHYPTAIYLDITAGATAEGAGT